MASSKEYLDFILQQLQKHAYIYATNILTDLTGSVMLTLVHETIHPNRIYQHS